MIEIGKVARVRLRDGSVHKVAPRTFRVGSLDFFDKEGFAISEATDGDRVYFGFPAGGAMWKEHNGEWETTHFAPRGAIIEIEYSKERVRKPKQGKD